MKSLSVLGSGAWGTALALLLMRNRHEVTLWASSEEKAEELRRTGETPALPGIRLPDGLRYTASLKEAAASAEGIIFAVASVYTRSTAARLCSFWRPDQLIVCASKGIENETLKMQAEQVEEELPSGTVSCLSGPSHAEEVAKQLPTTCVAAAQDEQTAERVQLLFMSPTFRVYRSTDLIGVELGGSVKNVIALAAGIADGLGCGDNTKAALITRGIAEITRLGVRMGAKADTFSGLSGIGDLIVTCASMHSRNRRAGILIGRGKSVEEAMGEVKQVVEGVYSAKAALALAKKYGVEMPIVEEVNRILFSHADPRSALDQLMMRDPALEVRP